MKNYEIVKTPEFTWKVFRIVNEVQHRTDGKEPHSYVRKYWEATFAYPAHAEDFVEFLKQKKG
jgi:hypothetical protein